VFAGSSTALVRVRDLASTARIALSWDRRRLPPPELLAATRPQWFNPYYRLASAGLVERMHSCGMEVSVWTVDSRRQLQRAQHAGADAVITNRTARALQILAPLRAR